MPVVDTLKLKTRLSESGMPESQAQVLVEELDGALSTAIAREVATKTDMVELRAAIDGLEERVDQRLDQVGRRLDALQADTGKQLDDLRVDTGRRLDELRADTGRQLEEFRVDFGRRLDELRADTGKQLEELRADHGKRLDALQADNGSIRTETSDMKAEVRLLRWMAGAILTIVVGIAIKLLFM